MHRDLLPHETEALQAFADAHGKRWRHTLTDVYWYNARVWRDGPPNAGNTLHAIRNEFGPSWLHNHCGIKAKAGQ